VLGYKQCGERAVRVDILERLADLIRPALSWRASSPGEKPAGAFDGRSFVVTQSMTSLTGSAGEDFASILRALGYRTEKRPPLPPAPVEAAPAEAAAVEAVAAEAGAETLLVEASAVAADAEVAEPAAAVESAEPADVTHEVAQAAEAVQQTEAPQEEAAAADATAATASEQAPADASVTADAAPALAVTPELVDVWRPGGRSDERRPRHDRNRHRPQVRPQEGAQPVATEAEAGDGAKRERHGRPRRERNKDFRKPRSDAPAEAANTVVAAEGAPSVPREPREEKGRPPRERFQGKDRDKPRDGRDKGKFAGKPKGDRDGGRSSGGPSHRQYATSAPPRERERPIDPNSPFAKLAALKEQLTAGRKD
jgi:ATP-dependent RNA helicase SUPV3L1/SUV3